MIALEWIEGATNAYLIALAIAVALVLIVVHRVERRARRSDGLYWKAPGR